MPTSTTSPNYNWNLGANEFAIDPTFINSSPAPEIRARGEETISGFREALGQQESLPAMGDRLGQKYFLPQLREGFSTGRESYQDVLNQIRNVPEMVKGSTRESEVTESQRQAQVSSKMQKLAPLAESLGQTVEQIGQMLTDAEANMNTEMQFEIAQQKKELEPFTWQFSWDQISGAMEMSGWSTELNTELSTLLNNQQTGVQMSEAEKNRMHELSMQEISFENNLEMLKKQTESSIEISGETGATRLNNINALNSLWGSF